MKALSIIPFAASVFAILVVSAVGDDCLCKTVEGESACTDLSCESKLGGVCTFNDATKHCECLDCQLAGDKLCEGSGDNCADNGCERIGGKCDPSKCQCDRPIDFCEDDVAKGACYDYGCCFLRGKCTDLGSVGGCECCLSVDRIQLCNTNDDGTCKDDECRVKLGGECVYDQVLGECLCQCSSTPTTIATPKKCEDVKDGEGSYDICDNLVCDSTGERCFYDPVRRDCDCCKPVTATCLAELAEVRVRRQIAYPCNGYTCETAGGDCDQNCRCLLDAPLCDSSTCASKGCKDIGGECRQTYSTGTASCECVKCA